jgi:hypothetical protein
VPLLLLGLFIILFVSTTMLSGMTGNSLHMQWPLTSQWHGSFLISSLEKWEAKHWLIIADV